VTGESNDANLPMTIKDYGLIGDCTTAALLGRNGSIDWLCWPRFDSAACLAMLLGNAEHGRWSIRPADGSCQSSWSDRGDTMVLVDSLYDRRGVLRNRGLHADGS
jgi:GH15 family glucan-1,4-alpha-glucosidase